MLSYAQNIFDVVFIKNEDDIHKLNDNFTYKGNNFQYIKSHVNEFNLNDLLEILIIYDLSMHYKDYGTIFRSNFIHKKRVANAFGYIKHLKSNSSLDFFSEETDIETLDGMKFNSSILSNQFVDKSFSKKKIKKNKYFDCVPSSFDICSHDSIDSSFDESSCCSVSSSNLEKKKKKTIAKNQKPAGHSSCMNKSSKICPINKNLEPDLIIKKKINHLVQLNLTT